MKILYGVQGTGNGHITRARAMAEEFRNARIDVDYIFSGRPNNKYFDMSPFGDYKSYPGLTFTVEKGKINHLKTVFKNKYIKFLSDSRTIPVENYDLVITDFEPLTAWAAKRKGIPSLGISHQYAFRFNIPRGRYDPVANAILKYFAPADDYLGVHWHHFNQPILPPISQPVKRNTYKIKNKILVYLPFINLTNIIQMLQNQDDYQFYIYHDIDLPQDLDNLHIRSLSRKYFHEDLATSAGVICNTGFTLISEAIQHGNNILTYPLPGQGEQLANAEALKMLDMAVILNEFNGTNISRWLDSIKHTFVNAVEYPNVAHNIVSWIKGGMQETTEELAARSWDFSTDRADKNGKKNYFYAPLI
jgi:uncharacterized protein (TIGR00661 family)